MCSGLMVDIMSKACLSSIDWTGVARITKLAFDLPGYLDFRRSFASMIKTMWGKVGQIKWENQTLSIRRFMWFDNVSTTYVYETARDFT